MDKIKLFCPKFQAFMACFFILAMWSCTNEKAGDRKKVISPSEKQFYAGKGIGPVTDVTLPPLINDSLAGLGEKIFYSKCTSCHNLNDEKKIGPGLKGITLRRTPEWIMNQIINPLEMTKRDSLARELLSIYLSQMTPMDIQVEDAQSLVEFFRKQDKF